MKKFFAYEYCWNCRNRGWILFGFNTKSLISPVTTFSTSPAGIFEIVPAPCVLC